MSDIGASYDIKDTEHMRCFPSLVTKEKYTAKVQDLESSIGRLIPKEDMQEIEGLHKFLARFLYNGTHSSNAV